MLLGGKLEGLRAVDFGESMEEEPKISWLRRLL